MKIHGGGTPIRSDGGYPPERVGISQDQEKVSGSIFENGVKPAAKYLLSLSPDDRQRVQDGLKRFAQESEEKETAKLKVGDITPASFNAQMVIYTLCQIISAQNDLQLSNLAADTADINAFTDLNSKITEATGAIFRAQIGDNTDSSKSGVLSEVTANYQAFTAKMQQQLSMFTSGASQVSTAATTTQQNTSSIVQLVQGFMQAVAQSFTTFMRAGS